MIVTKFGKFKYNHLRMGMCTSEDIFQAKVDKLLSDIEVVKTHSNDILILIKDWFPKHTEQLKIIFCIFCVEGLKVSAPKCSFGINKIPYLGYAITREDIKPDPKKVQKIMYIGRPNNTTEAQVLIGMVQYYRDMCPRQSHILPPLKEADRGPKRKNILWNDTLNVSFK